MFNLENKKQTQTINRRTFFVVLGKFGIFSLIGWRFFDLQILNSSKYETLSKKNQINIEILYPIRGEITDRNNNIIATNTKVYDLYIVPEQSKNLEETLNNLNYFVNFGFKEKRKVIELSKKLQKFESIKVLENLNWNSLEIIETNKNHLSGLHLKEDFLRVYPGKDHFSHILGYISQPSKEDFNLPNISKMPQLSIGKTGLEKFLNNDLIGEAGTREIEVNAKGRIIREISKKTSNKGKTVKITIDQNLQKFTYEELKNNKAGSVVVLDINSGEILSMVSIPSFDPNLIINKPNLDYWQKILDNPLSPLTNRSIQGLYSPGSTFKMIVALAALKDNLIKPSANEFCEGKIEFGDRLYHCWKTKGHGSMNLETAIKESCDVYFYELAKKVGIDRIEKISKEFGLGQKFNIGFENEKKGVIPSKKWKKENLNESWFAGETLNAGIGQGYSLTTPLQLAVMTARIASNGKKIEPTIFKRTAAKQFNEISELENHIQIIKQAMFKVVNESKGTANSSKSSKYFFSGKTGTSQVKRISVAERESEDFRKKEIEWKNKDHALFVGYMPSKNPKYAVSVIVEHGGSGASVAAPIAKKIFDFLYQTKIS